MSSRATGRVTHMSSDVPLPPANAPLEDTLKDLVQLSNSGSAAASMRLFRDLKKCALRPAKLGVLNRIYYHKPGQTDTEYAQQIEHLLEHEPAVKKALKMLDSTDALCKGISADVIEARSSYLRQAALQHDPEAMVCYATTYELGPKNLSNAWFDYVARWQHEAPYFAEQALEAGRPGILAVLIDAYMPGDLNRRIHYNLSEVVGPNPKLAYALSLLYVRLAHGADLQQAQENLVALSGRLQPSQLADAQAMADALWPRFEQATDQAKALEPCAEFLSGPTDYVTFQNAQ